MEVTSNINALVSVLFSSSAQNGKIGFVSSPVLIALGPCVFNNCIRCSTNFNLFLFYFI